ncbi:hypothetical protein TNIN_234511 [Trichonephila inaurata madagascariensis]|uniref:Uncharacterized protein n=1 Tax=Trichonephila inaurata madagascariensis TaxID=2747483 RepID=A0A8X6XTU5_9ARAC|nr:hypothetical protein TNIN_234511 [Trichonephila inaurata madagascariensis]
MAEDFNVKTIQVVLRFPKNPLGKMWKIAGWVSPRTPTTTELTPGFEFFTEKQRTKNTILKNLVTGVSRPLLKKRQKKKVCVLPGVFPKRENRKMSTVRRYVVCGGKTVINLPTNGL